MSEAGPTESLDDPGLESGLTESVIGWQADAAGGSEDADGGALAVTGDAGDSSASSGTSSDALSDALGSLVDDNGEGLAPPIPDDEVQEPAVDEAIDAAAIADDDELPVADAEDAGGDEPVDSGDAVPVGAESGPTGIPESLVEADLMPAMGPMLVGDSDQGFLDYGGGADVKIEDVEGDGFVDDTGSGYDGGTDYSDWTYEPYDHSGYWRASAGDVNGDGLDDVVVTAYSVVDGVYSASTHVSFGTAEGTAAAYDASSLDGSNGFRIDGAATGGGNTSIAAAGDLNGDGFGDLIASTYGWGASGAAYVVFGGASLPAAVDVSALDGSNGFRIEGLEGDDYNSWSVGAGGDINGDGFADLIVDTWQGTADGSYSARTYVVLGHAGGFEAIVDINALDGTNGYELVPDPVDPGPDGGDGEVIIGIIDDGGVVYDDPPGDDSGYLGPPISILPAITTDDFV